jgi:4-hydroxybenzoate polyprenyltransferase
MESGTPSRFHAWAQLVRLPNVFTVLADVSAAFLLVAGGPQPLGRWICVVLGAILLYWAGMILNDVFDWEEDRRLRPKRPIAAGHIPLSHARAAGWTCLILGVIIAAISGYLPSDVEDTTWLPAVVAVALAIMVVAYDGPLKSTYVAPAAMGACRMLSFLLGASPCLSPTSDGPLIPKYLIGIAFGFGVYITGVTTMARHEATGGAKNSLRIGIIITVLGAVCLALSPQLAPGPMGWHIPIGQVFPVMIGMIAFPVIMRAIRTTQDPTPANIQTAIRVGVLTIIPLAACFAMLGAGPVWGLAIFALVVPALVLAIRFRVT